MSYGLYVPPGGSRNRGETGLIPCRFRWPRGDKPYRETVRAKFYRVYYGRPRVALWLCVPIPPIVAGRLLCMLETWTLAQQLVVDAALCALACLIACVLDSALFGRIVEGQPEEPDSPCLRRAETAAYEWRQEWLGFEAGPLGEVLTPFAGPIRWLLPCPSVQSFDLTPLVQGLGVEGFLARVAEMADQFTESNPGTIARHVVYNDRPAALLVTPIAWEPETPERATAHVWLIVSEPDTVHPGAVLRIGSTIWFPGGLAPDRSYSPGDDTLVMRFAQSDFAEPTLWSPIIAALFVWPIGVLCLAAAAIRERRYGYRYLVFRTQHSPYFGESLDLWLLQRARERRPNYFPVRDDSHHRRQQSVIEQFKQFFSATGGRGGAR